MATRGGDQERAHGVMLAPQVGQVRLRTAAGVRVTNIRPRPRTGIRRATPQHANGAGERRGRRDLDPADQLRLGGRARTDDERGEPVIVSGSA